MAHGKFKRDVIIAGDDGRIYHLSEQELAKYEVSAEQKKEKKYDFIESLLKSGVSTAAVPPEVNETGSDSQAVPLCYVLNLASFKKHTVYED